jgi:hydrogenase-4 component B
MHLLLPALTLILVGGVLPLIVHRWFRLAKLLHLIGVTAGCLTGLVGLQAVWRQPETLTTSWSWLGFCPLVLTLDSVTALFLLPVLLVAPVLALYAYHYLDKPAAAWRTAASALCFSLLVVAMALVTLAGNMVTFAIAWELMSIASWCLVLHDFERAETRRAGTIYFLFTQTGALLILAAFGLVYQATGSLAFTGMAAMPEGIKSAVFFLALAGFGSKAGVLPLHIWLPHAHPAAPSHVSALLSGVMIKMGIYGIVRTYLLLGDPTPLFPQAILLLGMASGILGVVHALGKHDLKRLLAYHSIENIGIILLGLGLGMLGITVGNRLMAAFGFAGALLHVLNHALFKSLLFLGAGAVLHATGTRHLDRLGGLLRTMPVTGRTFLAGSVAIAGLPPLNGFVSEFLIYYAAFQGLSLGGGNLLLCLFTIVSLALIGGLASACFAKVAGVVFLGEPRTECARQGTEAGSSMRAAMVLLTLACFVIGLWPEPLLRLMFAGLRDMAPLAGITADALGPVPANLALGARLLLALVLLVALGRHLLYRKKAIGRGPTWGCGYSRPTSRMQYTGASFARSMVEFHRPFVRVRTDAEPITRIFPAPAAWESRVEDAAEIGLTRGLVEPVLRIAARLHWIQHGRIQLYIAYIVLTIVVLLLTV